MSIFSNPYRDTAREKDVEGYIDLLRNFTLSDYSETQMDEMAQRRTAILKKYRNDPGMNPQLLRYADENKESLTEAQARSIMEEVDKARVHVTAGVGYSSKFFVLTNYPKIVVDAEDIFAIGMTVTRKYTNGILCAYFTNDPYVPVFPALFFIKSADDIPQLASELGSMCPNLTYFPQDMKKLKKQIAKEKYVRGELDGPIMTKMLKDAMSNVGYFSTGFTLSDELAPETKQMLWEYGYMDNDEIEKVLKLDSLFSGRYWKNVRARMLTEKYSNE